jgi:cation:H+ antiporter
MGSNMFNVFFILGASSKIRPLPFSTRNNLDIAMVVLASLLLFLCMFTGRRKRVDRWEALLFLSIYSIYISTLAMTSKG